MKFWQRLTLLTYVIINFTTVSETLTPSEAIHRFFDYFRNEEPLGIPVANIPEPLEIMSPLETSPIILEGGKLYGHSKFKIEHIYMDFLSLTGHMKMTAPRVELVGNYTWPGFFDISKGFVNATLVNTTILADLTIAVDDQNNLQVTDMMMNQTNDNVALNFTNLLWEHDLILSSGVIHVFFDDISKELFKQLKPLLMDEANREISKFISTLPPLEHILPPAEGYQPAEGDSRTKNFRDLIHRLARYVGMEPLLLPDKDTSVLGIKFKVTDLTMYGVSNISRIDSLYFIYEDKRVNVEAALTYPTLYLFYNLKMKSGAIVNLDIFEKNQLNDVFIKIRCVIDPSLINPPVITYLDIEIGSFGKIRSRSSKNIWGKIANAFSKFKDTILREIVNALQGTIRKSIQRKLDGADIENELINLIEKKQQLT